MSYPYGYGPPPGWGVSPYPVYGPPAPQTDQSRVVYVPMPNPAKETDDPVTAFLKQKEMIEKVEKIFKKEGDKPKDAKGLSVKDMWWLLTILALPVGMTYGGVLYLVIRGLRSL